MKEMQSIMTRKKEENALKEKTVRDMKNKKDKPRWKNLLIICKTNKFRDSVKKMKESRRLKNVFTTSLRKKKYSKLRLTI
jgi:hypothetical protein